MELNKTTKRLIAAWRPFSVVEIKDDPHITKQNGKQSSYNIVGKNGSGIAEFGCDELAATWFCEAANRYADEIYTRRQPTNELASADVIADLRDLAEHRDWNNHTRQSNRERVSDLADRLEAAIKREVDKLNSAIQATVGRSDAEIDRLRREIAEMRQAGDAAKLREAVKRIVAASIVAKNANAPEWILQRMADIFVVATTALSSPPRNCDKYVSLDEARNAYMAINEMPEGNRDEDMRRWLCDLHNWFFAPATEGGAK